MRWKITTSLLAVLLLTGLLVPKANAQDSHYWINSYGTRAQLLGGLVVGSIKDLSATYYNPGAMALTQDLRLILTTDALELSSLQFDEGVDEGGKLSSTRFASAPKIFAIRIKGIDQLSNHDIAFTLLTRYDWKFKADTRTNTPANGLPGGQDTGILTDELITDFSLSEGWGGLTYAVEPREGMGVGVSGFVAVRSQSGRLSRLGSGIDSLEAGSSVTLIDDYRYSTVRVLFKGGVSWDMDPTVVGITVTTPSLHIWGDGRVSVEQSAINLGEDHTTAITANAQDGLTAVYRSPLSIALGISHSLGRTSLHTTAEWFDSVAAYDFIEASGFMSQSTGESMKVDYSTSLRSIINFGLGVEHAFSTKTSGYAALTVDHSPQDGPSRITFSDWNLYHLSTGAAFSFHGVDFTTGLTYSRGSDEVQPPFEFNKEDIVVTAPRKATYRRLKLLFGVSVGI